MSQPLNNTKDQHSTALITSMDKEEQYVMGIKYLFGDGVEENPKQGLKLLKQAATQRHLEAQFLLGQLFQVGFKTLQPNQEQAIRWYKLAAGFVRKGRNCLNLGAIRVF